MTNVIIKISKRLPFIKRFIKRLKGLTINDMLVEHIDNNQPVIIDVGANIGQTIDNYLKLFKRPIIYSFEPTPQLFLLLQSKYKANKNIILLDFALSDSNGEVDFFESDFSPTNSLLEPNIEMYQKVEKSNPSKVQVSDIFKKTLKTAKVNSLRFDDWYLKNLKDKQIDIFKIDTQGFELEVLMGAKLALNNIKFIVVECHFEEFYKGSKPFYKIFEFLYDNGFYLYNLDKKNHKIQIFECNAIFINSDKL
jgi:FkbM family methyltransferase